MKTSSWTPPKLFPRLWDAKVLGIDVETRDNGLKKELGAGWATNDGYIVGVAIKADEFCGYYPVAHEAGGNLDKDHVWRWLRKVLDSSATKVFHNAIYDVGWLLAEGFKLNGKLRCTQAGASFLNENRRSYSLDAVAKDFLGKTKDETHLKQAAEMYGLDPKADLWRLHSSSVGPYAEADGELAKELWLYEEPKLIEQGLMPLYDIETDLIECLVAMRRNGIRIDVEAADKLKTEIGLKGLAYMDEQYEAFGVRAAPKSNGEIAAACDKLHIPYERTPAGNPTFKEKWLAPHPHPFLQHIRKMRRLQTMGSLLKGIVYDYADSNGRIHCELHPWRRADAAGSGGTVSGRFSCSNPNLQQVPERDPEWGPLFRSLFLPELGQRWNGHDYSQQEYRLVVHYAMLLRLPGAAAALAEYRKPGADFHQIAANMIGMERKPAKNINFGIVYTMGDQAMAENMGVDIVKAEALLAQYHEKFPFVQQLSHACSRRARQKGFVKTILGRRCRFDLWEPRDRDKGYPRSLKAARDTWPNEPLRRAYLHKAISRVIQGSGADITKKAMRDCYRAGYTPLLQVHDELDFSISDERNSKRIHEIMVNAVPTDPPMVVDSHIGDNWYEAH